VIQEYLNNVWNISLELAPWLLVGAALSGMLHGFLPKGFVRRHLSGRMGVLKAVALGIPLPLCSCGVIPAGLGLKKDGASDGAAVGFLIATPQTGVDSMLVSASFLGWPFALFKVAAAAITGIVGGLLTDRGLPEQEVLPLENEGPRPTAKQMLEHSIEMVQSIWGWLSIGVLISAALTTFLPPDALTGLSANGGLVAMGAALLISLPLYVCATASVPIAAALVAAGLPTGAALVFLMAGPATNIATLGAVYRTLGKTPLVIYLSTIVGGSILFGLLFDGLIPIESIVQVSHEHVGPVSIASAVLLIGMVAWFAFSDARLAVARLGQGLGGAAVTTKLELNVQGMTCGGCARKVEKGLLAVEGVDGVTVDQPAGRVQVSGSIDSLSVIQAVETAGFSAQVRTPGLALHVGGMTCGRCASKVKVKLGELDGVQGVEVDLDEGIVRVIGPVSMDQVTVTVAEAGFAPGAEI